MASEPDRQIGSTSYMKAKGDDAALTADEMLALIAEHARCEQARDWSGALATMTDDADYDFYPYRLRISGPEALVGLWTRLFPEHGPIRCFDAAAHIPDTHFRREYLDDDSFVSVSWSTFRPRTAPSARSTTSCATRSTATSCRANRVHRPHDDDLPRPGLRPGVPVAAGGHRDLSELQTEAAVDPQGLAGDVRGLRGREERTREHDLVVGTETRESRPGAAVPRPRPVLTTFLR